MVLTSDVGARRRLDPKRVSFSADGESFGDLL